MADRCNWAILENIGLGKKRDRRNLESRGKADKTDSEWKCSCRSDKEIGIVDSFE